MTTNYDNNSINLTIEQLKIVNSTRAIVRIHSVFNGKLIVACQDGLLRMIEMKGNKILWRDSY